VAVGYTPIYRIYKGEVDITDRFNDRTTKIMVELNSRGADGDKCEITVDDRDWKIAFPSLGGDLEIWLGYEEVGLAFMGKFEIDVATLQGPPKEIVLHGESSGKNSDMKSPKVQEFDGKTVGEILGQIAGGAGIGAGINGAIGGISIPFKNQLTSNYHIIHELERLTGGSFKIANGKIVAVPRDAGVTVNGEQLPILVMRPEHFGHWKVRWDLRTEHKGVMASYWDKFTNTRKFTQFMNPSGLMGSGAGIFQMGKLFASEAEAKAAAQAQMGGMIRDSVRAFFNPAKGDPWIRDGQPLLITGMRDGIDGSYQIQRVVHSYQKSTGLMTEIEAEAPGTADDYLKNRATEDFLTLDINETLGEYLLKRGGITPKDGAAP
jgi:phage protein D